MSPLDSHAPESYTHAWTVYLIELTPFWSGLSVDELNFQFIGTTSIKLLVFVGVVIHRENILLGSHLVISWRQNDVIMWGVRIQMVVGEG